MELKNYQRNAIKDLEQYLLLLDQTEDPKEAYRRLWKDKGVAVGCYGMESYCDILPGVPNVCFKVPTGGGKTFLAACAIKPIIDSMPYMPAKAVVWLVPSDSILEQTTRNLKNPNHPYRQRINADFGGRVEIYNKDELLNGQNFNPTSVHEQLSIMVLSYDSFRGRSREVLRAYRENSNLTLFAKVYGKPQQPIQNADESALFQVINTLNPLVIVDESHHARSELSIDMLKNFNPCFVLDLTATPKDESNLVSIVDAYQLKRENMVKLPVVVYNRNSQEDVIADAVALRETLEGQARLQEQATGKYVRPIVLFQAQPRSNSDSTTFQKVKDKLVAAGIPENHVAIKTADINEIKGLDLLSKDCEIRYIITVNALKEGWDCPFAYILASLANKTSVIDVEQILGRVLRQPYTQKLPVPGLNISYVLTSSVDFQATVDNVVKGLNKAGFSRDDYRVGSLKEPKITTALAPDDKRAQVPVAPMGAEDSLIDEIDFNPETLRSEIDLRRQLAQNDDADTLNSQADDNVISDMIVEAERQASEYEAYLSGSEEAITGLPGEIAERMRHNKMKAIYAPTAQGLRIPQFMIETPPSLLVEQGTKLLELEDLRKEFTLRGKSTDIDFTGVMDEVRLIDIEEGSSTPKSYRLKVEQQRIYTQYLSTIPKERQVEVAKSAIKGSLDRLDSIDSKELEVYVGRVIEDLDEAQLNELVKNPYVFARKIRERIGQLAAEAGRELFKKWTYSKISVEPKYALPDHLDLTEGIDQVPKSLYELEAPMNAFERKVIEDIAVQDNVLWWHRIIERKGFKINGFINHYPDFMVMTKAENLVLIETKGADRDNTDSANKIELGQAWQSLTSNNFWYFMVFQDEANLPDGAMYEHTLLETLREM